MREFHDPPPKNGVQVLLHLAGVDKYAWRWAPGDFKQAWEQWGAFGASYDMVDFLCGIGFEPRRMAALAAQVADGLPEWWQVAVGVELKDGAELAGVYSAFGKLRYPRAPSFGGIDDELLCCVLREEFPVEEVADKLTVFAEERLR